MHAVNRSLVVLAVTALAVAACGRGEDDGGGGANVSLAPSVPAEDVSGSITVWAMGTEGENLGVLAEDFMGEYPEVTVEVTAVPWDAAHDRLATAIAGQQTPDVSMIGTTWMGEFASAGAFDPTPANFDPEAFFEGAWNTTVVQGTSYAVPWYVETRLIYYRTDLAEEAGFSEPPGTWEELKQMAQGMVDAGAEVGLALQPGGTGAWQTFMPFAWQAGGGIMDENNESFILDSEANVEAIEYYDSYFTDGLAPTSLEPGALEQGFIDGSIGAFISGPWHIGLLEDQGIEEGVWGLAHMPENEAGTSFVGGSNMVVFSGSENKPGAWAFIEYLMRPEVQVKWYETVNDLPSVREAWENEALSGDEHLQLFGEQLEDAKAPPSIPTWEEIASVIDGQLEQVTVGDEEPQAAADAMQQEAESIGTGL